MIIIDSISLSEVLIWVDNNEFCHTPEIESEKLRSRFSISDDDEDDFPDPRLFKDDSSISDVG